MKPILVCVFDAYGTLFDVHSAVKRHSARLGTSADAFSQLWRTKQLEYTWLRSLMHTHADFWQVTQEALEFACETYGVKDEGLKRDLLGAYLQLDCYPEVKDILSELSQRGYRCAILSNGSPMMLASIVQNTGLEGWFEKVISVEDAGIFKPAPAVYQLAENQLKVSREDVCFITSNGWDAAGASRFGFRTMWVNRSKQKHEHLPYRPEIEINSLSDILSFLTTPIQNPKNL